MAKNNNLHKVNAQFLKVEIDIIKDALQYYADAFQRQTEQDEKDGKLPILGKHFYHVWKRQIYGKMNIKHDEV